MNNCPHLCQRYKFRRQLYVRKINNVETVKNVARKQINSFYVPVTVWNYGKKVQLNALVDSGATNTFINKQVIKSNKLSPDKLAIPITVTNVDGTENYAGQVTHMLKAYLEIGSHKSQEVALIADLGEKDMIIGYDFLTKHNPDINWKDGEWEWTRCPENCKKQRAKRKNRIEEIKVTQEEVDYLEYKDEISWDDILDDLGSVDPQNEYINWISTGDETAEQIAATISEILGKEDEGFDDNYVDEVNASTSKVKLDQWKEKVPREYWDYGIIFSEKASERMPTRKPYDHGIEFVEGAKLPKKGEIYKMSPEEKDALAKWIEEEKQKGYIRESKSPVAAPVFFVKKKDGKLQLVVDYRKINDITIKNSYPIPRVDDLVDALSEAKVYTKLDLRWGYNNVRIKKGD